MNWSLGAQGLSYTTSANATFNPNTLNLGKRRPVIQGRTGKRDDIGRSMVVCSECEITYPVMDGTKPVCPLCEQMKVTQQVRDALFQLTNANHILQNQKAQLEAQVDQLAAMRAAFDTMDPDDLAWVKSVVYRWQADRKGVVLKPIHKKAKSKRKAVTARGFVAIFRNPDNVEEYFCTSVGGLALATYLDEAQALTGQIKAMETLARAALAHLEARLES